MTGRPPAGTPLLTVLVPVRNAGPQMPEWLASVSAYADRVIALDDGSTDHTREILDADPLVAEVLTNPIRTSYHGWDDLANRQRLVHAALARGAEWLLFLDADESLDEADGQALRRLLAGEARPGFAYGFENLRMVDDEAHYDPRSLWVYRLFHARDAGGPLGSKRLHFVPVPSGIPRRQWLQTSIRMRHFGSLTREHRSARFAKYGEADPNRECQREYGSILEEPPVVLPWPAREPTMPVLLGPRGRFADQPDDHFDGPALSVVVIAQDDAEAIERVIGAIVTQLVADEFEVILVGSGDDDTVARAGRRFPEVRCVQLPRRVLPGEARNAGLWMARGEYITFVGSHVELLPGSLQARLDAHERGWELVSGGVANGNLTRAGWANYFLDHVTVSRSHAAGQRREVPGSASFVTRHVQEIGGFPEDMRAGEDTVVNRTLLVQGKRVYFCPAAAYIHESRATTVPKMALHHFQRGRGWGKIVRSNDPDLSRRGLLRRVLKMPKRRLRVITTALDHIDTESRRQYRHVRGAVTTGVLAATAGACLEVIAGDRPEFSSFSPATPAAGRHPILAIGGRARGEAPTGLLSHGSARQAAQRLQTFAAYGSAVCRVSPALAPIVTSATITNELEGTCTLHAVDEIVDAYYRAARSVRARLILQLQPGRAELPALLVRWRHWLRRPDVDVLLDVRKQVAFAEQHGALDEAVEAARDIGGADTVVLTRGASHPAAVEAAFVDLRQTHTPWPHDALMPRQRAVAVVYQ